MFAWRYKKNKMVRRPGIEPGSTAWKAAMLTTIPPTPNENVLCEWIWDENMPCGYENWLVNTKKLPLKKKRRAGPTEIWTQIAGFRVQSRIVNWKISINTANWSWLIAAREMAGNCCKLITEIPALISRPSLVVGLVAFHALDSSSILLRCTLL